MTDNKKPFGLTLACKITAEAIQASVAPVSVILYNLLDLQKSTVFPKNLDQQFFAVNKKIVPEQDKRIVTKILDKLRGPHIDTSVLLEEFIKNEWVIKKALPRKEVKSNIKPLTKNTNFKNNNKKVVSKASKTTVKKEAIVPVVTIKKHKVI